MTKQISEIEKSTDNVWNNPHDSLIMQAAVEEIVNNITNSCFSECKELNTINDSPDDEDEIINELEAAAFTLNMAKGTDLFDECEKEFLKVRSKFFADKNLKEEQYKEIVKVAREKAEKALAALPNCTQRLVDTFEVLPPSLEATVNDLVLTIEEPKAKSSKTGKSRKSRSKKAVERVMDRVCENLFPEVTAVAVAKPVKVKTASKRRRYCKKDTEKLMNIVCADLFDECYKGLNLLAA